MIVSIAEFNEYTQNFEDSTEAVALKTSYLLAAEQIVSEYLGYSPEQRIYDEFFSGIGDYKLYLHARPIKVVSELFIDRHPVFLDFIGINDDYIYEMGRRKIFTEGTNNIHCSYIAGYTPAEMPDLIKVAIMRIAALMLQEQGGNIGLTGKSMGENSRTYINYSSYEKYLKPLDGLRVIKYVD